MIWSDVFFYSSNLSVGYNYIIGRLCWEGTVYPDVMWCYVVVMYPKLQSGKPQMCVVMLPENMSSKGFVPLFLFSISFSSCRRRFLFVAVQLLSLILWTLFFLLFSSHLSILYFFSGPLLTMITQLDSFLIWWYNFLIALQVFPPFPSFLLVYSSLLSPDWSSLSLSSHLMLF